MYWIDTELKARTPHVCDMCGCKIDIGTKYIRQFHPELRSSTKMHKECQDLLGYEGFYDDDNGEGTDGGYFQSCVCDYVWQHHQHEDDTLDEGWNVPVYEQVKMILKELEN